MQIEYCDHCGIALIEGYKSLRLTDAVTANLCEKDANELFEYVNKYLHLPSHQPQMYNVHFLPKYYEQSSVIQEKPFIVVKNNFTSKVLNFIIHNCYKIIRANAIKNRFD